jgi:hypothetical protein
VNTTLTRLMDIVREFLEIWDSPDSPEAMAEIVERMRQEVEE